MPLSGLPRVCGYTAYVPEGFTKQTRLALSASRQTTPRALLGEMCLMRPSIDGRKRVLRDLVLLIIGLEFVLAPRPCERGDTSSSPIKLQQAFVYLDSKLIGLPE